MLPLHSLEETALGKESSPSCVRCGTHFHFILFILFETRSPAAQAGIELTM